MVIDNKAIRKAEKALGIKFYPWQRAYLKREEYDGKYLTERKTGKSIAYIVRILLECDGKVTREMLCNMADYPSVKYTARYRTYFTNWAMEINAMLEAAGVYRYAEKMTRKEDRKNGRVYRRMRLLWTIKNSSWWRWNGRRADKRSCDDGVQLRSCTNAPKSAL